MLPWWGLNNTIRDTTIKQLSVFRFPLCSRWASLVAQMVRTACNEGDQGFIPGSGRPPGEENGNTLQYSCLENSMDRGAWHATVHRVTKSQTGLWLTCSRLCAKLNIHAITKSFFFFLLFIEVQLLLQSCVSFCCTTTWISYMYT